MPSAVRWVKLLSRVPGGVRGLEGVLRVVRREPPFTRGSLQDGELRRLVGRDDPVILDVGANDGVATRRFLRLFPRARVHAFEPDRRARERFRRNVDDERATLHDLALSDRDGSIEFFPSGGLPSPDLADRIPEGWDYSGSIRRPKNVSEFHPWCTFDERRVVPTRTLDSWCEEHGIDVVDFLWADVQGAEVDLIEGARQTLRRTRYIHTEYHNWEMYEGQADLRELMRRLGGFEVLYRYRDDVLFSNLDPALA